MRRAEDKKGNDWDKKTPPSKRTAVSYRLIFKFAGFAPLEFAFYSTI